MSNLFKSGFQGLTNISSEPFVVDANKRIIENQPKIIRSIEEKEEIEQAEAEKTSNEATSVAGNVILDDAMNMAQTIREDARIAAAKIIADAEAEAESIRQTAKDEGYRQGLEDGSMEAMKRADNYLANIQQEQEITLRKQNEMFEERIADTEKKLVDLSCTLIEKLTGILVHDYKPVLLHIINNALSESEASRNFVIRVSEKNYQYVEDNRDRLVGSANPNINIEVFGDSKLDFQQCIIESDNGIIDLSMDIQTRNLITAMKLLSQ